MPNQVFDFDPDTKTFEGFVQNTAGANLWIGGTSGTALVSAGVKVTSGIFQVPANADTAIWITGGNVNTAGNIYIYPAPADTIANAVVFAKDRATLSVASGGTNSAVLLSSGALMTCNRYCIVADNSTDGTNNLQLFVRIFGKQSKTD
jgi:hypothetical protein